MVDQIKNIISNSVKQGASRIESDAKKTATKNIAPTPSTDSKKTSINVSQFVNASQTKEMAKEPPINKENISRIKDAISSGSYPIDIEKISEALLTAYKEMK